MEIIINNKEIKLSFKSRSDMSNKEMLDTIKQYVNSESKIYSMLESLPNWNNECECTQSERNSIMLIEEDKTVLIATYCITCGGFILR